MIAAALLLGGCATATKPGNPLLTAASFNLRLAPKKDSNMWQERKEGLSHLVLAHNFDIFGTQEGFKHQLDDIAAYTGYKYVGVARDDGKESGEYSAIFYNPARVALLKTGDFWFAETPDKPVKGWDAACKRICTWGKFKDMASEKEFYFFSLHFDHKGKIARAESAKLLLKKIREIAGNETFFCVGDFNAYVDSEPMRIIFADKSMQDSKLASKSRPYGPEGTYHAFKGTPRSTRIDYIITSRNVDIYSYETISDKLTNFDIAKKNAGENADKIPEYPSDHFPIAVKAAIK